jgi:hypothetical protein
LHTLHTDQSCWLQISKRCGKTIFKGNPHDQISCQNLIFLPSPTTYLNPLLQFYLISN